MAAAGLIGSSSALVDELAQVIGQPSLMKLCEAFGGTKLYVPARFTATHPIAATIGMKAATILSEHYYGTMIDLPKAHLRRTRVLEMAQSGTMTIADAARACDYTERRVYQLLAEAKHDDGQLDLFKA